MRLAETSVLRGIWRKVIRGGGDKSSGVEVAVCVAPAIQQPGRWLSGTRTGWNVWLAECGCVCVGPAPQHSHAGRDGSQVLRGAAAARQDLLRLWPAAAGLWCLSCWLWVRRCVCVWCRMFGHVYVRCRVFSHVCVKCRVFNHACVRCRVFSHTCVRCRVFSHVCVKCRVFSHVCVKCRVFSHVCVKCRVFSHVCVKCRVFSHVCAKCIHLWPCLTISVSVCVCMRYISDCLLLSVCVCVRHTFVYCCLFEFAWGIYAVCVSVWQSVCVCMTHIFVCVMLRFVNICMRHISVCILLSVCVSAWGTSSQYLFVSVWSTSVVTHVFSTIEALVLSQTWYTGVSLSHRPTWEAVGFLDKVKAIKFESWKNVCSLFIFLTGKPLATKHGICKAVSSVDEVWIANV